MRTRSTIPTRSSPPLIALLILVMFFGDVRQLRAQSKEPATPERQVSNSNNTFGFDLYQKLAADPASTGKNLLFSPHSAATMFSILLEGAGAESARQIATALHLPVALGKSGSAGLSTVHDGAQSLRSQFAQSAAGGGFELLSASGLWIDRRFSPSAAFTASLHQNYGMEGPTALDFKGDPKTARQTINAWGDKQTRGKIKEMLAADPSPQTAMALANTVYFQATWLKPFEPTDTTAKPFHVDLDAAHDVSASMMSLWTDDNNPYLETPDFQMTLLLYGYWKQSGDRINAIIPAYIILVLPKRIDGLAGIEKDFTWQKLDPYTDHMDKAEVHVWLPKFRINAELDLKSLISQLGAGDVFDPAKADLSGIAPASPGGSLFVSTATQRAIINVDEKGTEVAAESMNLAEGGKPQKQAEFRADHPFLFYIIHAKTNAILFMGRVVNPTG